MTSGWYTPVLSADFLELPSAAESGLWRFFYLRWSVA